MKGNVSGNVTASSINIGGVGLNSTHAGRLTGRTPFKLYQTGGTTGGYDVCKSGYVISGGDCVLYSGATKRHTGHWDKPENWAQFILK